MVLLSNFISSMSAKCCRFIIHFIFGKRDKPVLKNLSERVEPSIVSDFLQTSGTEPYYCTKLSCWNLWTHWPKPSDSITSIGSSLGFSFAITLTFQYLIIIKQEKYHLLLQSATREQNSFVSYFNQNLVRQFLSAKYPKICLAPVKLYGNIISMFLDVDIRWVMELVCHWQRVEVLLQI